MKDDMHGFLEQAIDRLPPKYRSVLVLREIEQLSTQETADCLGLTVVNVKVCLFRAKSLLRAELEKAVDYRTLFSFRGAQCDAMTEQVMDKIRLKMS
jgi:RNA polymerase sigma-70 factor (ECF subfamily)